MSPLSLAKPAHPSAEEGNSNIPFSKVAPPNVPRYFSCFFFCELIPFPNSYFLTCFFDK